MHVNVIKALRGPAARTMTSYCSWSHLTTVPRETGVPRNIPWETWSRDSMNHHPRLTKARGSQCRFTPAGYGVHICAKSLQSCPTLCNSVGSSLPDASVCGVSRQEYWSGLPCSPPGDLPNPGIKPRSPALQADSLPLSYLGSPVSGIQQSNSDIHIHISILFHILFPFRLLHNIKQSSL